jgi:hypothetical protein
MLARFRYLAHLAAILLCPLAVFSQNSASPQAQRKTRTGNIYDAYQRLSEGAYRTRKVSTDLSLALKYKPGALRTRTSNRECEPVV